MVTAIDYTSSFKSQWCPGCGNFGILEAIKDALVAQDLQPRDILMISGIGQAAKTPHFMRCNMFHSLHGRALPLALGAKMANHDLKIIVNSGDGDCYGEGGNHFMHAVRRNTDLTLLVHNNQVYGLTKGQASPTSAFGMKTPMQPNGVMSQPFNGPAVALSLGAGFVARGFSGAREHLARLIREAMAYKGLSLIDIMQPCVSFNKINTFEWYKKRVRETDNPVPDDFDAAMKLARQWGDTIPIGIFYQREQPDFTSLFDRLKSDPLIRQPYDPGSLQQIFQEL
ncbi:MAG: thiamine pyrophosphate-dependent enzyme [Pseudomonadota bacterium]